MENMHSELKHLVIENAKLKASLKAAKYEKEKLLELVKNLLLDLDASATFNEISDFKEPDVIYHMQASNTPCPESDTR